MSLVDAILDLLFPPKCVFCKKLSKARCCPECREKYLGAAHCQDGMYFSQCWVPLRYEGPARDAILRYKFQERREYSEVFGKFLADCIREHLDGQFDLLTWVPVSAQRKKERGYDQAQLLAQAAAKELGCPAVPTLEKTQHNPAQSTLHDREARRKNVRDVYRVPDPDAVADRRILLLDDIITTGSTLDAASRVLLAAGAREVLGAALAQPVNNKDTCEEEL
jgi:ComF family protein